jgi:hypothetical protein
MKKKIVFFVFVFMLHETYKIEEYVCAPKQASRSFLFQIIFTRYHKKSSSFYDMT